MRPSLRNRHFLSRGVLAFVAICTGIAWPLLFSHTARSDAVGEVDGGEFPVSRYAAADQCVILVSLDGFAHFYVDDPLTHMPTLRRMIREGAEAEQGMECSFPTVTWPNHTTLVTGVPPAKHGVLANMVFDRDKGEPVQLLIDPVFDKDEIVKVPTIYDVAHAAGMKTAAVVWPATRNAKTLDWTVPDMKSPLFEKFATPGWLDELKMQGIPVDRYGPWVDAKEGGPRRDWIATREVISLLRKKDRPNLILLHLIELDHAQHETGPRSGDARWAVATMDDRIRDLRDAVEELGLSDKVTLLVTSDHGFFATERSIHVNVKLRELGLVKVERDKAVAKTAWAVSQGGAAAVYITDSARRDEIATQIKQELEQVEGVEAAFKDPKDFQKLGQATEAQDRFGADVWLAAKEGYSFSNSFTADAVVTQNKKRDGTHGYLPSHPDMRGIFIAWGRGIAPGTKLGLVQNTQVAPSIAKLLGLDFPTADGKALAQMLSPVPR